MSPSECDGWNVCETVIILQHTSFPGHDVLEISILGSQKLTFERGTHTWLDGHGGTCGVVGITCLVTAVVPSIFVCIQFRNLK